MFLVLSHIFLSTYFERDGQVADCRAAQVIRYCFEQCVGSAGAEPCHCVAAGVVTVRTESATSKIFLPNYDPILLAWVHKTQDDYRVK